MKMAHNNEKWKAALPAQTTETGKVSLNDGSKCPQCDSQYNNTNFRKVTDDCGHSKCRRCLAESEEMCNMCKTQQENNPSSISSHEPKTETHSTSQEKKSMSQPGATEKTKFHQPSTSNPKKGKPGPILDHITVLTVDPPMFQCQKCNKKFKTKANQNYHKFCQIGDTPIKCELCGKGMIAKSHYEYHLRKHTGELPCACKICNIRFINKGELNRHMRTHTGEKRYVCQQCNRGFVNSQNLKTHTYTHTGERNYPCTKCSKRFTNLTNLRKHLVTHTGEKNFLCNHCGASFSQKYTLDVHLATHSNNRPHSCGQCTRAFKTIKDLKRHCRTHTGELPFRCTICERQFPRQDNLQRHVRNVHKQSENETKLVSSKTEPQLKTSTASKSSPVIPRNVQRNLRTHSEHKKVLEEKMKNLRQCEKGSSSFSLEKALPENVDNEEGNEMVIHEEQESFELPNRDSNPTLVLVTPDMHDTADKEIENNANDVNNTVEEPPGFEGESEQQTSFTDLFLSCPILIDENELLGVNDQMQVDNATQTHDKTSSSEAAHGTQIFTLEVQGQDENQEEFENALSISENENREETSGGINLLHQSTSSPPSAEIQAGIQGNRGPRKYYISRYYFVHQTDSSTSS